MLLALTGFHLEEDTRPSNTSLQHHEMYKPALLPTAKTNLVGCRFTHRTPFMFMASSAAPYPIEQPFKAPVPNHLPGSDVKVCLQQIVRIGKVQHRRYG